MELFYNYDGQYIPDAGTKFVRQNYLFYAWNMHEIPVTNISYNLNVNLGHVEAKLLFKSTIPLIYIFVVFRMQVMMI